MPAWPVVLSVLRSRWLHIGLLVLACAVLWMRGSHYRDDRDRWHSAFTAQKAAYVAAQEAATAKAIAAKLATEAHYRAQAEKTDDDYQTALARAVRAADAYRMRNQASRRASSGTAPAAPGDGPESPDGPGGDAVLLGRHDFDVMVENSVRLKAAHDWAKTLNAEPIPNPAF